MNQLPIDPALLAIQPLAASHDEVVAGFACGNDDLDDFLKTDALRLQDQRVVRTFVAFHDGTLAGYAALLVDAVELKPGERKKLALRFQDHPVIPALKIARLAVSERFRATHRGMGTSLLRFAYAKAIELAEHAGCRLLTLDAYPDAIAFYERLGFVRNQARTYEGRVHPSMRLDVFAPAIPGWVTGE